MNDVDDAAFYPEDSGPLDWVESGLQDPQGRARFTLYSQDRFSFLKTDAARRKWVNARFEHCQHPFLMPLLHKDADLQWQLEEEHRDHYQGTLSVPRLLGLPGVEPHKELIQFREFLHYLEAKRAATPPGTHPPRVQWYRGGYKDRGLEWAGIGVGGVGLSDEEQAQWARELREWENTPWFAQWKKTNLDGMARLRSGAHCWFAMSHLRSPQAEMRATYEASQSLQPKPKTPGM